jgi:hypothetical protein
MTENENIGYASGEHFQLKQLFLLLTWPEIKIPLKLKDGMGEW